jgi:hypothetical protein
VLSDGHDKGGNLEREAVMGVCVLLAQMVGGLSAAYTLSQTGAGCSPANISAPCSGLATITKAEASDFYLLLIFTDGTSWQQIAGGRRSSGYGRIAVSYCAAGASETSHCSLFFVCNALCPSLKQVLFTERKPALPNIQPRLETQHRASGRDADEFQRLCMAPFSSAVKPPRAMECCDAHSAIRPTQHACVLDIRHQWWF